MDTAFITRFSDDRDKYRHRITAENCVRGKEELVKSFYHRVKQNERDAQKNLRNQKKIDFTIRGLTPSGLKRKAHEYLIEHPNTTWDNFKDHVANKDLIYSVSSEFVPNSTNEQNSKLDSLEKQVRDLSTLPKEQQVNALNQANTRTNDVNNKSRQNATRFCHYCRPGIPYNFAELKLLMTNQNVSTIARTNRKSQPSPMTITRERDQISDHKTTTTPILSTTPILHKDMVITIVNRIIETKISTIKIITTRVTLIKDRIGELGKITTTFPQGRITTPIFRISEISL